MVLSLLLCMLAKTSEQCYTTPEIYPNNETCTKSCSPGIGWWDSYEVEGRCYCKMDGGGSFDHGIGDIIICTPVGPRTVREVCQRIHNVYGEGSPQNRKYFNTIQCGHGPANDAGDEDLDACPGRVDMGSAGCHIRGVSWDLDGAYTTTLTTTSYTATLSKISYISTLATTSFTPTSDTTSYTTKIPKSSLITRTLTTTLGATLSIDNGCKAGKHIVMLVTGGSVCMDIGVCPEDYFRNESLWVNSGAGNGDGYCQPCPVGEFREGPGSDNTCYVRTKSSSTSRRVIVILSLIFLGFIFLIGCIWVTYRCVSKRENVIDENQVNLYPGKEPNIQFHHQMNEANV
eukprot:m.240324 g.240324  ORF g.240324 m.240324 type:complete len:344 (-) comp16077_c0_seq7:114-1145(-)